MEGKGAGHDEHCWGVDVLEGQIAHELCLDDRTNLHQLGPEVVHITDGCAGGNDRLDLAEVFLGLAEEFLCFVVVRGSFAFLCK